MAYRICWLLYWFNSFIQLPMNKLPLNSMETNQQRSNIKHQYYIWNVRAHFSIKMLKYEFPVSWHYIAVVLLIIVASTLFKPLWLPHDTSSTGCYVDCLGGNAATNYYHRSSSVSLKKPSFVAELLCATAFCYKAPWWILCSKSGAVLDEEAMFHVLKLLAVFPEIVLLGNIMEGEVGIHTFNEKGTAENQLPLLPQAEGISRNRKGQGQSHCLKYNHS